MPSSGAGAGLSPLQRELLEAFFRASQDFYLTGGAALIGFYDLPRATQDLDLFSESAESLAHVDAGIKEAARSIGATAVELRSAPYFRRYEVTRGDHSVQVDLVHEPTVQICSTKNQLGLIRVDPIEEIFANKICTLVGRAEVRDFWDVHQLVQRGLDFEQALEDAALKEGGVDTESLVFVLQGVRWSALRSAAAEVGLTEWDAVAGFFQALAMDLARRLLPDSAPGDQPGHVTG